LVRRILVIVPFEEKIYRDAGVPADFVGHPLADVVAATSTRGEFAARHGIDARRKIVALLPGSRIGEMQRHMPILLDACRRLDRDLSPEFLLAATPSLAAQAAKDCEASGVRIRVVTGETYNALAAADCALVSSGTATVECALLGTPMVVFYRVSPLSALVMRFMLRTPFIAMANLIAARRVVPELVQNDFTSANLEAEARRLLTVPAVSDGMRAGLAEVRQKLGGGGAIERAADIIASALAELGPDKARTGN
jgi:lipid-A-disaccharide synthase